MPESLALSAALNGRRSQALQISTGSQTVQRPTSAAAAYYWGLHKSATSHQNQKYSPWDQSTQQLLQKDPGISPLPNMAPVEMEHCSTPHPRKKVFDILQWSFGHHQYQQIFWSSQFLLAAHGKVQATVHARGSSLATQFGKMDICDDSPPPIPGCCRCQPQLWHVWWESACILQKKTQSPRLHRPFQLASWPNGGNLPFRWPPTHVVECLEVHVSNVKWKKKQRFRRFLANGAIFYQLGNALPIQHKVHHIGGPVPMPTMSATRAWQCFRLLRRSTATTSPGRKSSNKFPAQPGLKPRLSHGLWAHCHKWVANGKENTAEAASIGFLVVYWEIHSFMLFMLFNSNATSCDQLHGSYLSRTWTLDTNVLQRHQSIATKSKMDCEWVAWIVHSSFGCKSHQPKWQLWAPLVLSSNGKWKQFDCIHAKMLSKPSTWIHLLGLDINDTVLTASNVPPFLRILKHLLSLVITGP